MDECLERAPLELVVGEVHVDAEWQQDPTVINVILDAGPPEPDVEVLARRNRWG